MSTKIYYAWRIEGLRSLKQIHEFGRKTLAPAIKEIVRNRLRSLMADIDGTPAELRKKYIRDYVLQKDKDAKKFISPKIEMAFYPSRKGVMLIPFCEGSLHGLEVREYLDSLEGCVPWGYWNNTDRPQEVSRREWRQRRKDWNSLFDSEPMIPSFGEVGLTMTLHTEGQPWADQIWPPKEYPEMWADMMKPTEDEREDPQ